MVESRTVLVTRRDGYHEIVLNRPDKLNAFTVGLHGELMAALREAEADDSCRAVLITGAGRAFCAGQDLNERVFTDGVAPDLSENLAARYNPLTTFIRNTRLPVVAAVNGVAAGAGASLAFACDIVIAAHSAKFVQSFSRIGLIPDAGGTWILPRLIGDARARALFMLADTISAKQAAEWGMVWKITEDSALLAEAADICLRLAATPGSAIELIKRALATSQHNTLDQQLAAEAELQRQAGIHPEYRESVERFRRKA
ncbi:MAG TPA: enoyl-CoA hydratase-related protein [Rhizobiaceae bacterium]|nr:enoyl-CoA hydratase-related protein [Rhizobiaceae bacterium]